MTNTPTSGASEPPNAPVSAAAHKFALYLARRMAPTFDVDAAKRDQEDTKGTQGAQ